MHHIYNLYNEFYLYNFMNYLFEKKNFCVNSIERENKKINAKHISFS